MNFSASYRALDESAARAFRLLGLHPGPEFSLPVAAALVGMNDQAARRQLDVLVDADLLQFTGSDRYRLHELLRGHALEQARADEAADQVTTARRRGLVWYLRTVDNGHKVVLPNFHDVPLPDDDLPVEPLTFPDVDAAMEWFELERTNLMSALETAMREEQYDIAWRLPAVTCGFFELRGYWTAWRDNHETGLSAARHAGDRYGEACNYLGLGDAKWLLRDRDGALECYRESTRLAQEVGDPWIEGFSLRQTGVILYEQKRIDEAVDAIERAIEVFRTSGEQRGRGMALITLGDCLRARQDHAAAVERCREAVTIFTEIGDRWSIAWGRCALGLALGEAGEYAESLAHNQDALAVFREFGNKRNEARALIGIGEAQQALGRLDEVRRASAEALTILDSLDDPQLADLRERAERLDVDGGDG
ncbi:tetratricopeptide repeat protein [Actinomadura sp. NPDC047616]|uniref:tetratricopeptide repeat protein n=1 Tax=Actinomadura sp. NPDC047616 TaxID=3155914 RepID=UPI0033F50B44